MDAIQSGIKEALKEQRLGNYVASHYWEMSKEQLKDVLLETIYSALSFINNPFVEPGFYEDIEDELKDRGFFDD